MAGLTGGVQGVKGTLFGIPYEAGSWQDHLIEAFAGPHDLIGGKLSGLYDDQGNIKRGLSNFERVIHDRTADVAILPATPFAFAELLPSEVWNAMAVFLKAAQ
mgnify:FL=1